jgi:hypothetical protein
MSKYKLWSDMDSGNTTVDKAEHEGNFFSGCLVALPFGLLFWGFLIWLLLR